MPRSRLFSCRGFAPIVVVYAIGGLFTAIAGYKFLRWDPTEAPRLIAASKQLEDSQAKLATASAALDAARATQQQHADAVDADTKRQTQSGQTWVAATGQALAGAPAEVRSDLHVAAALQANTVAAQSLEGAVGPLTSAQLQFVVNYVANATSASEARRAQADAELTTAKQQLAALQTDKQHQEQLTQAAEAKVVTAQQALTTAQAAAAKAVTNLNATLDNNSGLSGVLAQVFFWLKVGLLAYVLVAYILPLLAHAFPGLRPFADLAHAVLAPLAHKAKGEAEKLARDASAATHDLLAVIANKAPELLAHAQTKADAWITEADGTRARFDKVLREAQQL